MIIPYGETQPRIADSCFIAPIGVIVGDVNIGTDSSIWFGAVIRGGIYSITIGRRTNIQDNAVVHATHSKYSTAISDYVTCGHSAILHGCTIKNECIIGMNAVVPDDSVIGEGSIVAADPVVKEHKTIPSGVLAVDNPVVIKCDLTIAGKKRLSNRRLIIRLRKGI